MVAGRNAPRTGMLAVAIAGNALNGRVPAQLFHLVGGNFQFFKVFISLEGAELIAQLHDFLGGLERDGSGAGQFFGEALTMAALRNPEA